MNELTDSEVAERYYQASDRGDDETALEYADEATRRGMIL